MTTPILTDSSGKKIGKTEGNIIALDDKPEVLFGKIMSLPDEVIVKGLEYLTRVPMDEVKKIEQAIESGENPMMFKKELARQIVSDLNDPESGKSAEENFEKTFSKGEAPENIKTAKVKEGTPLVETLIEHGLVTSKTEFNRLSKAGAIKEIEKGVYRIGKHRFLKIETD